MLCAAVVYPCVLTPNDSPGSALPRSCSKLVFGRNSQALNLHTHAPWPDRCTPTPTTHLGIRHFNPYPLSSFSCTLDIANHCLGTYHLSPQRAPPHILSLLLHRYLLGALNSKETKLGLHDISLVRYRNVIVIVMSVSQIMTFTL